MGNIKFTLANVMLAFSTWGVKTQIKTPKGNKGGTKK